MRSIRCDACGTKALMAASTCPKCGHGIEVRDGFGELLPLSHCSTCDSYYPAKLGACRWCGTQPARAPIGPYVWKGAGVVAFVAMAWGAWLVHNDPPAEVSAARMSAILKPDSSASTDSVVSAGSLENAIPGATPVADSAFLSDTTAVVSLPLDSLHEPLASVVAAMDAPASPSQPATTVLVPVDSAPAQVDPTPVADPVRDPAVAESIPASPPAEAPVRGSPRSVDRSAAPAPAGTSARTLARAPVAPRKKPATKLAAKNAPPSKAAVKTPARAVAKAPAKSTSKSRARVVWVSTVSRNWVVVRAGASRTARVIASIGPNTRVQLGEARGGWRRIRAKGLSGWVEHRSFFATASPSRGGGRLAAR
jgi:hypothetical protein